MAKNLTRITKCLIKKETRYLQNLLASRVQKKDFITKLKIISI